MISREDILNLATLARLKVADSEVEALRNDIGSILTYVGQVANVEGAKEKAAGLNRNVLREDVPYAEGAMLLGKRESLLKAFPQSERSFNVVRKIIEKDEQA